MYNLKFTIVNYGHVPNRYVVNCEINPYVVPVSIIVNANFYTFVTGVSSIVPGKKAMHLRRGRQLLRVLTS